MFHDFARLDCSRFGEASFAGGPASKSKQRQAVPPADAPLEFVIQAEIKVHSIDIVLPFDRGLGRMAIWN